MGSTAMVSGAPERVRVVRPALEQVGFEVIGVDGLSTPDVRSWRHQPDPDDYDW